MRTMIAEEVYFWRIQWAGTWMITHTRHSETAIRKEHPEAIRVEGSLQAQLTPETPQERVQAITGAKVRSPDVCYRSA
jgi:hypothetical protein